jgi:hypothetical protein
VYLADEKQFTWVVVRLNGSDRLECWWSASWVGIRLNIAIRRNIMIGENAVICSNVVIRVNVSDQLE